MLLVWLSVFPVLHRQAVALRQSALHNMCWLFVTSAFHARELSRCHAQTSRSAADKQAEWQRLHPLESNCDVYTSPLELLMCDV